MSGKNYFKEDTNTMHGDYEELQTELQMYKMKILLDHIDKIDFTHATKGKAQKTSDNLLYSSYIGLPKLNSLDHRTTNLLGMAPPKFQQLSCAEQKAFIEKLENEILLNLQSQLRKYDKLTNGSFEGTTIKDINRSNTLSQDQEKIIQLSTEYLEKILALSDINDQMYKNMSKWIDIRLGSMLQKTADDVSCLTLKGRLLELKMKVLNAQYKQLMYKSDVDNTQKFTDVQKDIAEMINKLKNEIDDFKSTVNRTD